LAAELALTAAAFRLFVCAGILKMSSSGSECWKDHTCLYTHFYTQPMPNPVAWYFHNWTTPGMKRFMQWFAIDVSECIAPYLLLAFLISTGPMGFLHKMVRRNDQLWWAAVFPARLLGSILMGALLMGMFVSGNYAFLLPLSLVALVASCGTARCAPMMKRDDNPVSVWYRHIVPWVVMALAIFAVLPGVNTVQWLLDAKADVIGDWWGEHFAGFQKALNSMPLTQKARDWNLGMDQYRFAYFAGAVEERQEWVFTAEVGAGKWIEFDVPCKVGSVDRAPCFTSPFHRRFAWQLWFPFGDYMFNFDKFFQKICEKDPAVWGGLEMWQVENALRVQGAEPKLTGVARQAFTYHFTKSGDGGWWTREASSSREVTSCSPGVISPSGELSP